MEYCREKKIPDSIVKMLREIPLLRKLNSERKLVFFNIEETLDNFLFKHQSFNVQKKNMASFNNFMGRR
jgi:hypothetical protein